MITVKSGPELIDVTKLAHLSRRSVLYVGPTGVGKSEIASQAADEKEIVIDDPGLEGPCVSAPALSVAKGPFASSLYHNVTPEMAFRALCLSCGTSLEQSAPESRTPALFEFVHGDI